MRASLGSGSPRPVSLRGPCPGSQGRFSVGGSRLLHQPIKIETGDGCLLWRAGGCWGIRNALWFEKIQRNPQSDCEQRSCQRHLGRGRWRWLRPCCTVLAGRLGVSVAWSIARWERVNARWRQRRAACNGDGVAAEGG